MITCKEDLINTYIENDHGKLRDLYLAEGRRFGLYSEILKGAYTNEYVAIMPHYAAAQSCSKIPESCLGGQITLSDLKPRTKIMYEKVEFNHAWELVKQFELHNDIFYKSSSAPTYERMSLENIQSILCNKFPVSLYRKVEKEIDWREEVYNKFQSSDYHWSTPIGEVINDESDCFLDLCRAALHATGELEWIYS